MMYTLLRLLQFPKFSFKISGGVVVASHGTFRSDLRRDLEEICRRTGLVSGMVFVRRGHGGRRTRIIGPLRAAEQQIRNVVNL